MNSFWKLTLITCLLGLGQLQAQSPRFYIGAGLSTVRGEVSYGAALTQNLGQDYAIQYLQPLSDERLVVVGELSYSSSILQRSFSNAERSIVMTNRFSQTFVGVGMRYILNGEVNRFNPYPGQLLPFVGLQMGMAYSQRVVTMEDQMAQIFKTEPADPASGYDFHDGNSFEFNGQVEAGLTYVFNRNIRFSVSGSARPGFSDSWDGISGTTNGNDWLMRGNLGVQYAL